MPTGKPKAVHFCYSSEKTNVQGDRLAYQRFKWKTHRISVPQASPAREMFNLAAAAPEPDLFGVAVTVDLPDLSDFPKPIDKARVLLETAAEIEHALLAQYLYAALSVRPVTDFTDVPSQNLVRELQTGILTVAREEMGHLLTVQNLLHLAGLKSNLEREDFPFREDLYPFHLNLEPLTRNSLAKYVVAEMPDMTAGDMTGIKEAAQVSAGAPINRVGTLYALLGVVFTRAGELIANAARGPWYVAVKDTAGALTQTGEDLANWHLPDDAFAGATGFQAIQQDWGDDTVVAVDATGPGIRVHLVANRNESLDALRDIGQQGEGPVNSGSSSHFERFRGLWVKLETHQTANPGFTPARPVPVNPVVPAPAAPVTASAITHPLAKQWAVLFNLRYEILLRSLHHFLQMEGGCYKPFDAASPATGGDRTPRGFLNLWVFDEMRRIGKIGAKLAGLPRTDDGTPDRAAAPFTLPTDIANLHAPGADLWGLVIQARRKALDIARALLADAPSATEQAFLQFQIADDETAIQIAEKLGAGQEAAGAQNYLKIVQMLEEAVRGFDVLRAHKSFWRGKTRDKFIAEPVIGSIPIELGNPESSELVAVLRGTSGSFSQMPRRRPPIPESRIQYLEHWITQNCPDSDPAGQTARAGESVP